MTKETIELKLHCDTPMVHTIIFGGSEFYCVKCGWTEGVLGLAETVPWTPKLSKEVNLNQAVFRQIASDCIPAGCRFKDCKKCEGQDHLLHASNKALNKSSEAYKQLAGGIFEEVENVSD